MAFTPAAAVLGGQLSRQRGDNLLAGIGALAAEDFLMDAPTHGQYSPVSSALTAMTARERTSAISCRSSATSVAWVGLSAVIRGEFCQ